MRSKAAVIVLAFCLFASGPRAAAPFTLNSSRYGATFYWWYDHLPATTIDRPTIVWNAQDPAWWNSMIAQARDAGLGWLAPVSWGEGSNADPATLGPLVATIDRVAPAIKVALFDDTTSEVLRKNQERHGLWSLTTRFDLADLDGKSEGGLRYFYDQQWKRYFATVPDRYRLKINDRPVVFMWHGGFELYVNQSTFHSLIDALRAATRRDFGVDPFVIPEESWYRLDPSVRADALYDWFDPSRSTWTSTNFGGVTVGHVVPGFNCRITCDPPHPVVERQNGELLRAGLNAVAPRADLVLLEGLVNVDENAEFVETLTWGRTYLNIVRSFATVVP